MILLNCKLVTESTRTMAVTLQAEPGDAARLSRTYLQILGRTPRPDEQEAWQSFLDGFDDRLSAWQSVCRVLVSSNEFIYIE